MACEVCRQERETASWIYQNELWSLGGPSWASMPGYFILQLRRHAEGLEELSDAEAESLGPLVKRISRVTREVLGYPKTYLVFFGERYPHVHFAVVAVRDDLPEEHRGPGVLAYAQTFDDLPEAVRVADAVREHLGRH